MITQSLLPSSSTSTTALMWGEVFCPNFSPKMPLVSVHSLRPQYCVNSFLSTPHTEIHKNISLKSATTCTSNSPSAKEQQVMRMKILMRGRNLRSFFLAGCRGSAHRKVPKLVDREWLGCSHCQIAPSRNYAAHNWHDFIKFLFFCVTQIPGHFVPLFLRRLLPIWPSFEQHQRR